MPVIWPVGPKPLRIAPPRPSRVWKRIQEPVREKIKDLTLKEIELSPRELAVRFTDTEKYFVSEASVFLLPGMVLHSNALSGNGQTNFT